MVYNIAVIGCGVIGQRLGRAFASYDQLNLKYAVDLNQSALDAYCEMYSTKGYTDYHDVLALDDVDIVYIGIPPKWHFQVTIDALEAGKHVICEKPIGISAKQGEEMTKKALETDLAAAINFPFKYNPTFHRMKNMVKDGEIGEIKSFQIKIRMPRWPRAWQDVAWLLDHDQGGPLREIGSHFIYGAQEFFGPLEVKNSKVELTAPDKYEKEIQANLMANGIPGTLDLLTNTDENEENTLYVTGSKTRIRFRGWHILEQWKDGKWVLIDDAMVNGSLELSKEVVSAITGKGKLVSFDEATQVQRVVDEIFAV